MREGRGFALQKKKKKKRCGSYKSMAAPPTFTTLSELAQGSSANEERYESLVKRFYEKYGRQPSHLARAPGRVNLIGEHIDYCGYGVLPMAIEQDIVMAFASNDTHTLELSNVEEDKYPSTTIDISAPPSTFSFTSIDGNVPWFNYFLCGFRGIIEEFSISSPAGMIVMMDGSIPPSSGLSSSSALVCCAALVTVLSNSLPLPSKTSLANLCASSEKYIGTQGGGMDQAVSFLAQPGRALKIDFNPLVSSPVSLPNGYSFVVSHCNQSMNKAETFHFNERVVECRLAAKVLASLQGKDWRVILKFAELQTQLGHDSKEMLSIVEGSLHKEPYGKQEICQLLGIEDEEGGESLVEKALSGMSPQAQQAAKELKGYKLYQRARHVFSEVGRVEEFKEKANNGVGNPEIGSELGRLMNESHSSCSGYYECSCDALDTLISDCLNSGALGSRLTGAGWGGCAVSIVPDNCLERFLTKLSRSFYGGRALEELKTKIFATRPGPGAAVCKLK